MRVPSNLALARSREQRRGERGQVGDWRNRWGCGGERSCDLGDCTRPGGLVTLCGTSHASTGGRPSYRVPGCGQGAAGGADDSLPLAELLRDAGRPYLYVSAFHHTVVHFRDRLPDLKRISGTLPG